MIPKSALLECVAIECRPILACDSEHMHEVCLISPQSRSADVLFRTLSYIRIGSGDYNHHF